MPKILRDSLLKVWKSPIKYFQSTKSKKPARKSVDGS